VAVGGDDANSSRAQAVQEFIGCQACHDWKAKNRARRRSHSLGIERADGFMECEEG
jgi:hypothetical protein